MWAQGKINIKRGEMMICPKCKSNEVIGNSWGGNGKDYCEISYECKKCGNQFKEITDDREENNGNI